MSDLPVGRIVGLFGVRGELKCDPTSAGRALFVPGAALRLRPAGSTQHDRDVVVHLESVREHKGRLLVAFDEAQDADEAQAYIGATLVAARDELDVGEGEFLDVDLVGCRVSSLEGRAYGTVQRVEHYPASDMLIVDGRMLPMVKAFVRSIDVRAKSIVVDVPPGLLDEDAIEG